MRQILVRLFELSLAKVVKSPELREHGRRPVHPFEVERHVILPRQEARKGVLARLDPVDILPFAGVKAGMGPSATGVSLRPRCHPEAGN